MTSRSAFAIVLAVSLVAGCSASPSQGGDTSATSTTDGTSVATTARPATTSVPTPESAPASTPDVGRVIALGEEFLLADLLALGIQPVASTATVADAGFQGVDDFDTSGIEVLDQEAANIEYLATLEPDTVVTEQFFVDQVGAGVFDALADVVVLPDGLDVTERLEMLGEAFGRPERAAAVLDELQEAIDLAASQVPDDCAVTVASIYPGPSVAAYVDGPSQVAAAFELAGCALVPDEAFVTPDDNGRAFLSEERLGLLSGVPLVLLQSDAVDGESAAVASVADSALWQTLPAVTADAVVTIDRLGHPGVPGLVRLLREIPSILEFP